VRWLTGRRREAEPFIFWAIRGRSVLEGGVYARIPLMQMHQALTFTRRMMHLHQPP
jgi:hypothetical protein